MDEESSEPNGSESPDTDLDALLSGISSDEPTRERTIVDDWLDPLSDSPTGEDLEYDNAFLELTQAAAGKPETQFAPAEPPNWRDVRERAEELFGRTRDLRVALLWTRAMLNLEGFPTLAESLRLVHGLMDRYWDDLHPKPDPDDGDPYARVNELAQIADMNSLLGDVRQSLVIKNRSIGELRVRDVEIALEKLEPREDESPMSRGQIEGMLGEAVDDDARFADTVRSAKSGLKDLFSLLNDRLGYDRAPDVRPLQSMIDGVVQLLPEPPDASGSGDLDSLLSSLDGDSGDADAAPSRRSRGGGLGTSIDSRDDALRAIEMVCEYLERTEPTNPAQMLLRRAQRLINKNFLELVRELAPDAVAEVARIMGVDPESLGGGSSSSSESSESSW